MEYNRREQDKRTKPVQVCSNTAWLQLDSFITAHYTFAVSAFHTIVSCSTQKCLSENTKSQGYSQVIFPPTKQT